MRSYGGALERMMIWEAKVNNLESTLKGAEGSVPSLQHCQPRDSLKKLKHTSLVREYVKQFSSLMLDIKDMPDADKLYNFMYRLQLWAQLELRR
ncbi:hypothetical protein SLA2020_444000 [Shorea laevis]